MSEVESRTGAVSTLRSLRLPSPLIKPDVRISRIRLSDRLHCPAHGDTTGRLRPAVQLPRESSDLHGVVRLFANHRPSTSSKARLKQGSFPPPALPDFSSTMTLSDSHRLRIAATMELALHPVGLPRYPHHLYDVPCPLPRRIGRMRASIASPSVRPSVLQAGRHPHLYFRGLLRLHSRYGPSDRSTAQGGLCHEASVRPVARPNRSSATRVIDNSLDGSFLHW